MKFIIITVLINTFLNITYAQTKDTLINVGNHFINFSITQGIGTPIIFESGGGNDVTVWKELISPLNSKVTAPLIIYDRAGFGKSGIDTLNINITNEVNDLEFGLKQLGFTDKYFFVAHSLGGNYVMKFISNNPSKVKGAVFIDVVSPDFMTPEKATFTKNIFIDSIAEIKKESIGFYHLVLNYENTSEVLREASKMIKTPLTIIASGKTPFEGQDKINFINGLKNFADAQPNRKYILVKNADHYVFDHAPELVIEEIVKLYNKVK